MNTEAATATCPGLDADNATAFHAVVHKTCAIAQPASPAAMDAVSSPACALPSPCASVHAALEQQNDADLQLHSVEISAAGVPDLTSQQIGAPSILQSGINPKWNHADESRSAKRQRL